ncbi:MAG TPA: prephenate dehydrogenase/arogenate dehydrogenase family protein [Burkholderiaceae bacterium]|nr:prephenate dehydrogenase/arogenate dehydrogenase family protein [Burkholderiaceae bacterium]
MKLALIGVGLIGGSAAAAWRRAGAVTHVTGFDLDARASERGRALGILDATASNVADAVRAADLVLLAVPVRAMRQVLEQVAAAAPAHALITDVGSTKASVVADARAALGAACSRFVPGHPIAGRELPGVEQASATLFQRRVVVLTPPGETDAPARERVQALWEQAGARVVTMAPDVHDRVFAAVSHLPHLLAFALVAAIASETDADQKLGFAGAGFRDFTRIAASSPAMWRDVCLANRDALSEELQRYRALLDELQRAVDAGDAATLERTFALASETRRARAPVLDAE